MPACGNAGPARPRPAEEGQNGGGRPAPRRVNQGARPASRAPLAAAAPEAARGWGARLRVRPVREGELPDRGSSRPLFLRDSRDTVPPGSVPRFGVPSQARSQRFNPEAVGVSSPPRHHVCPGGDD